jgi:DNA-binding IclR family transcriptional regulator
LRLAASARTDCRACAPFLSGSRTTQRDVDLATIRKTIIFVDQVIGPHRLRAVSAVGEPFLSITANGEAYLAQLDEVAVTRPSARASSGAYKHDDVTICSRAQIGAQVR